MYCVLRVDGLWRAVNEATEMTLYSAVLARVARTTDTIVPGRSIIVADTTWTIYFRMLVVFADN